MQSVSKAKNLSWKLKTFLLVVNVKLFKFFWIKNSFCQGWKPSKVGLTIIKCCDTRKRF